ncbi:hypothetical protein BDV29DRAFT_152950 [Aspergillus leporis]|uniref:Uncharacterized protein n=1 Tax=Aspergillus leporis TaxID=41062 RepID=A0A5N5XBT6_9EURO|nr:hypothetical protein BDV29DRAFT_152950 [Aspergillus leporis]
MAPKHPPSSSPPPPYPAPPETCPPPHIEDPDLKTHTHAHTLLISITQEGPHILPTVLHYWNLESSSAILTKLTRDQLQLIRGFRELGAFSTTAERVNDSLELHRYFTPIVAGKGNREAVDFVVSCLEKTSDTDAVDVVFHLSTVEVFGPRPEGVLDGGPAPVWKWAKPESVYAVRSGFWEAEVESALRDGEWMGGKGLWLSVRGVSEGKKQGLKRNRCRVLFNCDGV